MRPGLRFPASSNPPPPDSSQRLGYPLPGWVSTLFQYMYSRPLRLVHWVLQAVVQVWQPMHLLRSITIAIWRLDMVAVLRLCVLGSVIAPSLAHYCHVHRGFVGDLVAVPLGAELEMPPAAGQLQGRQHTRHRRVHAHALPELMRLPGMIHHERAGPHARQQLGHRRELTDVIEYAHGIAVADAARGGVREAEVHVWCAALQAQHVLVAAPGGMDAPARVRRVELERELRGMQRLARRGHGRAQAQEHLVIDVERLPPRQRRIGAPQIKLLLEGTVGLVRVQRRGESGVGVEDDKSAKFPLKFYSPHTRWGIHSTWSSN